jgi:hypothetical protein
MRCSWNVDSRVLLSGSHTLPSLCETSFGHFLVPETSDCTASTRPLPSRELDCCDESLSSGRSGGQRQPAALARYFTACIIGDIGDADLSRCQSRLDTNSIATPLTRTCYKSRTSGLAAKSGSLVFLPPVILILPSHPGPHRRPVRSLGW